MYNILNLGIALLQSSKMYVVHSILKKVTSSVPFIFSRALRFLIYAWKLRAVLYDYLILDEEWDKIKDIEVIKNCNIYHSLLNNVYGFTTYLLRFAFVLCMCTILMYVLSDVIEKKRFIIFSCSITSSKD